MLQWPQKFYGEIHNREMLFFQMEETLGERLCPLEAEFLCSVTTTLIGAIGLSGDRAQDHEIAQAASVVFLKGKIKSVKD